MAFKLDNAEGGVDTTTVTTTPPTGAGSAFFAAPTSNGTCTYAAAGALHGTMGIAFTATTSAGTAYVSLALATANNTMGAQNYFQMASYPASTTSLVLIRNSAAGALLAVQATSAGKIVLLNSLNATISGVSTTYTLPTGTPWRIWTSVVVGTSTTGQVVVKIFHGESTTPAFSFSSSTENLGTTTAQYSRTGLCGAPGTAGYVLYGDDFQINDTGVEPGPMVPTAALASGVAVTAGGVVGTAAGSTVASSVAITASGVAGSAATLAASVAITAAGVVTRSTSTTVAATVALTTTGTVGRSAGATVAPTVAVTAAALVGKSSGAAVAAAVSIVAAGAVGKVGSATITGGVSVATSAGTVTNTAGTAGLAAAITIAPSSAVGTTTVTAVAAAVAILAAGLVAAAVLPDPTRTRAVQPSDRGHLVLGSDRTRLLEASVRTELVAASDRTRTPEASDRTLTMGGTS